MSLLKNIITNEIKDILGHEPSSSEYKSAFEYISNNIDEKSMLIDIEEYLAEWKDDCLVQCEQCGEWHLREEMEERFIGLGYRYVCDIDCAIELQREFE